MAAGGYQKPPLQKQPRQPYLHHFAHPYVAYVPLQTRRPRTTIIHIPITPIIPIAPPLFKTPNPYLARPFPSTPPQLVVGRSSKSVVGSSNSSNSNNNNKARNNLEGQDLVNLVLEGVVVVVVAVVTVAKIRTNAKTRKSSLQKTTSSLRMLTLCHHQQVPLFQEGPVRWLVRESRSECVALRQRQRQQQL